MVVTLLRSSFRRRLTKVLGCGWPVTQPNDFLYRSCRMVSDRENERVFLLVYAFLSDLCFSSLLLFFSLVLAQASYFLLSEFIARQHIGYIGVAKAVKRRLCWCKQTLSCVLLNIQNHWLRDWKRSKIFPHLITPTCTYIYRLLPELSNFSRADRSRGMVYESVDHENDVKAQFVSLSISCAIVQETCLRKQPALRYRTTEERLQEFLTHDVSQPRSG